MHCLYHLPCTCQSWVCTRGCQRRQNLLSRSVLGGEESSDGKSLKSLKLEMTDTWNSWRRVSYSSMVKSSGRSSTNSWPSNLGQGIKSDRLSSFIELNLFYIHDHCVITHTDSTEMSQWMNKVYPELCLQVAPSQYKTDPTYALCLGEFLWGMATVIITRGKRWRGDIGAMKDISSRLARFEMRRVEIAPSWSGGAERLEGNPALRPTQDFLTGCHQGQVRRGGWTNNQYLSIDQDSAVLPLNLTSVHNIYLQNPVLLEEFIRFTNATQQNVTKCEIFSARHFLHRKLYIFSPPVFIMTLNYKLQHKLERGVRCTWGSPQTGLSELARLPPRACFESRSELSGCPGSQCQMRRPVHSCQRWGCRRAGGCWALWFLLHQRCRTLRRCQSWSERGDMVIWDTQSCRLQTADCSDA